MSVTVLTPSNTQRLTTLAAVMAEITLEDQLTFAESLIDQASQAIARECQTIFAQQAYREVQAADYETRSLILRFRPLVSVTSVTYGQEALTDYRIESTEVPLLSRYGGWLMSRWGQSDWEVLYTAGYVLPEQLNPPDPTGPTLREQAADLERACIETVKIWFSERVVSDRIQARTLGDQTIRYDLQSGQRGLPLMAKDLLKNWRRMVLA